MIVDLHTHSAASDGQYTPGELVALARERGIELLALTDHDTVDGVEQARSAGEELGVQVLRGIELSAREYPTFHILGYCYTWPAPALEALCREMRAYRSSRNARILDFLREKGAEVSMEEVRAAAGGEVIGRPHIAQALLRRGCVSSVREAFERYLDTEEYRRRIGNGRPPVRVCIETLKRSGAKVSLAHPYQIGLDPEALDALVGELKEFGLDAIECFYPRHTPEMTRGYLALAEKYRLHATGGSDFHGERVKPDISLAALELDVAWLTRR